MNARWILCNWTNSSRDGISSYWLHSLGSVLNDWCCAVSLSNKQDQDTVNSFGSFNRKDDLYFVHTLIWYVWVYCVWIVLCSCSTPWLWLWRFPWSALKSAASQGLTFANLALKIAREKSDDFLVSWHASVGCLIANGIWLTSMKKSLVLSANLWKTTK